VPGGKLMITPGRQIRFGGLLLLWVIALAVFAACAPAFFSLANFTSILQFSTLLALVTLGQTVVILTGGGGIDLSVGGIVSLGGLLIAFLIKQGTPPFLAAVVPSSFGLLGQSAVLAIPLHTVVIVLPTFIVMVFTLTQVPLGRWIYAIGSNERASRLVGLPVNAIRLGAYTFSGILAALGGLVADSWLLSARPNIGDNLELLSLTATLFGGTSIFGGSGGLIGSLLAVLFFTSLQVGLQMLNINNIWQLGVVGLFLIGSVVLDRTLRNRETR
jgi:ribose transport system permease protein